MELDDMTCEGIPEDRSLSDNQVSQLCEEHNYSHSWNKPPDSSWYERKVLVREVFYVQTCLIFTVVIGSIANIILDVEDKQVWIVLLSTSIGHFLPCPGTGKASQQKENADSLPHQHQETGSVSKSVFVNSWNRRTIQARELFYARAVLVFAIVITSIVNLSIHAGDAQVWTVLLSGSFANMLPSPKLSKKMYRKPIHL